ncbi:PAS-domain containing protein [Caulobacter sp.]|uniref:PAS-domain containing protein n=1 Tax=Caulobacter sp. TaxID=78 RepID=UPI001618EC46
MTHSNIIAFEPRNPVLAYENEELDDGDRELLEELAETLASMPRGMCMIDDEARLIFCNAAFAAMYGLPTSLTRPGTTRAEIVAFCVPRFAAATVNVRDQLALDDKAGPEDTVVAEYWINETRRVRVSHTKIAGGGYVALHEEIEVAALLALDLEQA